MVELLGKSKEQLRAFCEGLGEPAYRGGQIYHALYAERKFEFTRMTNLPATLRERLAKEARITLPEIRQRFVSSDGSLRYLFGLRGAEEKNFTTQDTGSACAEDTQGKQNKLPRAPTPVSVEAVFMPSEGRRTICISTQAGCAVDCHFCLTAQLGLLRNLTAGEMVAQVLLTLEDPQTRNEGSHAGVAATGGSAVKIASGVNAPRAAVEFRAGDGSTASHAGPGRNGIVGKARDPVDERYRAGNREAGRGEGAAQVGDFAECLE